MGLKMKFSILIAILMPVVHGFLLDQTQVPPGGGNLNNQFVSASEFLSETNALRHHTDKTFALLTSQLQQQLSDLGSQIQNVKDLEANNTILQSKLDVLMSNFSLHESETRSLKNMTIELKTENANLKREISSLENITQQQGKEIVDLQQLKNSLLILDVKSLKQRIQSLTTETHALSVNEQARRQDFIALYNKTDQKFRSLHNKTLSLESRTTSLAVVTEHRFNVTNNRLNITNNQLNMTKNQLNMTNIQLNNFERDQSLTSSELNNSIISLKTELDTTKKSFDKKIETATEKVAITSCVTDGSTRTSREILKFDDIVTQAGISNIDSFKTTGKFTCSVPGLYHISVYVYSYTSGAQFAIYKNNTVISRVFIASHTGTLEHTGTGVVTLLLQAADTVWIKTLRPMEVAWSRYACLTIVKLK